MTAPITRRDLIRRASGLLVAAAVAAPLALLTNKPTVAEAQGGCPYCDMPFGPLHQHLWATAPLPRWQHDVIVRESHWNPYAKNPYSTASGLAQFLTSTFEWGCERFGIYGSVFDPYVNMDLMSAFVAAGETYHWNCGGQAGCYDV